MRLRRFWSTAPGECINQSSNQKRMPVLKITEIAYVCKTETKKDNAAATEKTLGCNRS